MQNVKKKDWSNYREFCKITHKREQLRSLAKKREEYEKDNSNEEPDSNKILRLVNALNHHLAWDNM